MGRAENLAKRMNGRLLPQKLFYGPRWVVLGVNNTCNLHCKMCDVGTSNLNTNFATNLVGTHPINMPLPLIKDVIDQSHRYFPNTRLGYGFTEPLVYPHLMESLEYAQQKGIYTSITTNALTLPKKAAPLVKAGLDAIYISLDGPQDIHNHIRGHKMSFQMALKGIEALFAQDRVPEIGIYCVITEWNIGYLKAFADIFKEYPITELGFMHTNFTPQHIADMHNVVYGGSYPATDSNVDEIDIDAMDLDLLWEEIEEITSTNYPFPVSFSPGVESKSTLMDFYHKPEKLMGKRCHDAFHNVMVKSDGSVIPAHGRCYNLTIGNLYDQSLKDIWNSSAISKFRSTLNKAGGLLPACSRCCSAFGS